MSKIDFEKATITITEQTVRELLSAIKKAHEEMVSTNESILDKNVLVRKGDSLSTSQYNNKTIFVTSEYSKINFCIELETEPHTQESLGYRLK